MIWRLSSSIHRPKPSAPALFEITVRSFVPAARISGIRLSGLPDRPKPPDMMVMPSNSTPSSAAFGDG
ncbi:hypothetical protein D3C71_2062540 [compost metagenome]